MRDRPRAERRRPFFGRVEPADWGDRPAFVVGGGPSLRGRDLSRLRERGRVLGVNRAADFWPVDATFSLDREFVRRYAAQLRVWATKQRVFLGVNLDHAHPIPGVTYLERWHGRGLSADPTRVVNGLSSGYGALNLALLLGAREVYLLGFDLDSAVPSRQRHWHDGYPWAKSSSTRLYDSWRGRFDDAARELAKFPGARVYNANPDSAVRAFPFRPYEELGL